MDFITDIIRLNKLEDKISPKLNDYDYTKLRYGEETELLKLIITTQLNLNKNYIKGEFERYTFHQLFCLLLEEVYELQEEIVSKENLSPQEILQEAGDVGAFLVGIIAKLLKEIKPGKDYRTIRKQKEKLANEIKNAPKRL